VGLRRLLNRQTTAERPTEPLRRLAEIGRAEDASSRRWPFADRATRDEAAPLRGASVDKKPELVSDSAAEVSVGNFKKAIDQPRRAPSYVWRSQRSLAQRSAAIDFSDTTF
jgi:hypothetical protein